MKKKKSMRLPNGYGSITKLSGRRRKPYQVRITAGYTAEGKQILKLLGCYETKAEAMTVLAEYNSNPYNLNKNNMTLSQLFEKFIELKEKTVDKKTYKGYIYSFNRCTPLHNMKMRDIKTYELQTFFNSLKDLSSGTIHTTKSLIKQLFKYAMELDIISKDYSEFIKTGKYTKVIERSIFTERELEILWENVGKVEYVDSILILIYTGMRVGEMLKLKKENIDLVNMTIKGGSKTEAGKNRVIPIHTRIQPLVVNLMSNPTDYLIPNSYGTRQISYNNYLEKKFYKIMEMLEMEHKPHDTRYTFATMMNNASDDKTAIKTIIGHKFYDTTEKIYIQTDIDRLKTEINKMN